MLASAAFCLVSLLRLDCSLELFAPVEDSPALSGGLPCGEMLAFHRGAPWPQTKLPIWVSSFGSSAPSRTDLLLSCWRPCGVRGDRPGEKDRSCHCFMGHRFSLKAHFLCKVSPSLPVVLDSQI